MPIQLLTILWRARLPIVGNIAEAIGELLFNGNGWANSSLIQSDRFTFTLSAPPSSYDFCLWFDL